MEGAPAFCANSMKIEAVETAKIPPSRAREMVDWRGVVEEEGAKGQEKSGYGIGLSFRCGRYCKRYIRNPYGNIDIGKTKYII
jgi:hypothetical protein